MSRELVFYNTATGTFDPVPQSGGDAAKTAASVEVVATKAPIVLQLIGTLLASGWSTNSTAPYTQTVNITGLASNTNGIVDISASATSAQYVLASKCMLRATAQGTNTITISAESYKPNIDLPITITVFGTATGAKILSGFPGGAGSGGDEFADYNRDIITTDANGFATEVRYTRADATLYMKRTYSNPNANGWYLTCVELYYGDNGATLVKTLTYTLTYTSAGLIDTSTVVQS